MILKHLILLLISSAFLLTGCAPSARYNTSSAEPTEEGSLLYHAIVAEIAGHRGALEESVRHYREVIRESDQLPLIRRAARIMSFAKDFEAADEAVHKWLALTPENMEAHQIAITINLNRGDIVGATEHLEWVLQHSGKSAFKVIASLLGRMNNSDAALRAMEVILSRHSGNAEAHVVYARMAFNAKKYEKAAFSARRATTLRPDDIEAQILVARSRIELGEVEQALDDLGKVVEQSSGNHELRLSYARLLVSSNRFESAIRHFKVLIKQAPEDVDLLYSTALVVLQIKNFSEAEQYFNKLLALESHVQESRYYLGRLEEDRKRYQAALDWYSQAEEGALYIESQMGAARVMAKLGDVKKARGAYENLRSEHVNLATRIWLSESDMLRELKQDQAAYDLLSLAVKKYPDDMELLYSRALTAESIDRIDILEQDLKVVLQNQPDHVHALNALGYTLADRTNRYIEALEYIKQALKLDPTDPAIIDSMGWVHYRLGNLEKALEYLHRASAEFQDSEISAHLGEVLWVSGNQDEATKVWDRALDEYPDSDILINVIRRFNP